MEYRFPERVLRFAALLAFAFLPGIAAADPVTDAEVRRLQGELAQIQQEQQSVYQNFQMTQDLRVLEMQDPHPGAVDPSNRGFERPPQNYDDMVRAGRERDDRLQKDSDELKRLYSRFLELEEMKTTLRDRIRDLLQSQH
jgi:hypothetical protein